MPEIQALHLCCGAGGTTLGFEQANIHTKYAFDFNPIAVEAHRVNFPEAACELRDIQELSAADLPEVNVWTCGIPCEPFSLSGKMLREADPRDISFELIRLIEEAHRQSSSPDYLFFENVPPYINSVAATALRETVRRCGYHIFEAIFAHANYGVPQNRRRWHMIAGKQGYAPVPVHTHANKANLFGLAPWVSFGAIRDRDAAHDLSVLTPRALKGVLRRQRRKVSSAMKHGNAPYNVMSVIEDDDMLPTVTSSWAKSLARNQMVSIACACNGHWYYRAPTELEVRRAQGFPDRFIFPGNKRERWEMIGRAVPPPFAKAVGLAIQKHHNGR